MCLGKEVGNDEGQETGQQGSLIGAGSTSSPHGQWVAEGLWTDQLAM